jgi:hypothetical protein
MGMLVAQPRGSVTPKPRKLAIVGPDCNIDMEPSIEAHDCPAGAGKTRLRRRQS